MAEDWDQKKGISLPHVGRRRKTTGPDPENTSGRESSREKETERKKQTRREGPKRQHRSNTPQHRTHSTFHSKREFLLYRKLGRFIMAVVLLILILLVVLVVKLCGGSKSQQTAVSSTESLQQDAGNKTEDMESDTETDQDTDEKNTSGTKTSSGSGKRKNGVRNPEDDIYTFLQGPQAWKEGYPWSGTWNSEILDGNYFSEFGCGMCCMANIYSSLSPYECSPIDMYDLAKVASDYAPYEGFGAISWVQMENTLLAAGLDCQCLVKTDTYKEFQEYVKNADSVIALISSKNDSSFWDDTDGHYITLWLYDEETDQVFLGDSGHPDYNREWISLEKVYSALRTDNIYQFMVINGYSEEDNTWKYNGITYEWKMPDYYVSKSGNQ